MPRRPTLPLLQVVLGFTLFASIALPLSRSGPSLLDMFLRLAGENLIGALGFLIMFASPQLFGLAVATAGFLRDEQTPSPWSRSRSSSCRAWSCSPA